MQKLTERQSRTTKEMDLSSSWWRQDPKAKQNEQTVGDITSKKQVTSTTSTVLVCVTKQCTNFETCCQTLIFLLPPKMGSRIFHVTEKQGTRFAIMKQIYPHHCTFVQFQVAQKPFCASTLSESCARSSCFSLVRCSRGLFFFFFATHTAPFEVDVPLASGGASTTSLLLLSTSFVRNERHRAKRKQ